MRSLARTGTGGQMILIIDDDKHGAESLARLLARFGCQVDVATSGSIALERVRLKTYQIVLLDLEMPEMDGLETYRRLKAMGQEPGVIVLTGHGSISSARRALELGAHDYFTKPFDLPSLWGSIQEAFGEQPESSREPEAGRKPKSAERPSTYGA